MGDVDWSLLHLATNTENKPTPGYVFNDIVKDVSHAAPKNIPAVATYLADCVDGDHAHVKLKALFVIKTLAYRVPPFCRCMQDRVHSVQEAAVFTGPPSSVYGDEPYRLVREAAEGALKALTSGEYYHEQYREMSQRIVGFGNYLPAEDTVLRDGSVDTGVTYKDVLSSAFGAVRGGVGNVFDGLKDVFVGSVQQKPDEDNSLSMPDIVEEDGPVDPYGGTGDFAEPEEDDEDVIAWQPSTGDYIAPPLPPPAPEQTPAERAWDDIWQEDEVRAANQAPAHQVDLMSFEDTPASSGGATASSAMPQAAVDDVLSETDILKVLGIDEPPLSSPDISTASQPAATAPSAHAAGPDNGEAPSAFSFINQADTPENGGTESAVSGQPVSNAFFGGATASCRGARGRPFANAGFIEV